MLIAVGSLNPVKVSAVRDVLTRNESFYDAEFMPVNAPSEVKEQPIGVKEIYHGAEDRAKNSLKLVSGSRYGVGIESGLERFSEIAMNRTICVIYDGKNFNYGEGSSFHVPKNVVETMIKDGITLDEAIYRLGITTNPRIGQSEGYISILTDGRLTRSDLIKQAVEIAACEITKKHLFRRQ